MYTALFFIPSIFSRMSFNKLATVVLPIALFNPLVSFVFLLPPSSGERVGLSVTLVLAYFVLIMGISTLILTYSKKIITLGRIVVVVVVEAVVVVVVEAVFVIQRHFSTGLLRPNHGNQHSHSDLL